MTINITTVIDVISFCIFCCTTDNTGHLHLVINPFYNNPVSTYLLKVINRNTRKNTWNMFIVQCMNWTGENTDMSLITFLFWVNSRNTRKGCETCWKLTIKTTERLPWRVFTVSFEHILNFLKVFLW